MILDWDTFTVNECGEFSIQDWELFVVLPVAVEDPCITKEVGLFLRTRGVGLWEATGAVSLLKRSQGVAILNTTLEVSIHTPTKALGKK